MKLFTISALFAISNSLKLEIEAISTCRDIRPKTAALNTVTISYYSNVGSSTTTGSLCNSCSGQVLSTNTFYSDAAHLNTCTTWPGHSGYNSIKNGHCIDNYGFSIDQRTTCDCSGTITTKVAYRDICVVDKPPSMCLRITNYTGCPPK